MFLGCPQSDTIVMDRFWGRWTLPTCSILPHTTVIFTIVCLDWPLEASRSIERPPEAQMSPNQCVRDVPRVNLLLLAPCWPSHTIEGGVPPALDEVIFALFLEDDLDPKPSFRARF